MEQSKTAAEEKQSGIPHEEQGKETNDSLKIDNPVTRKELAKASEILGNRTSSRTSSPSRSRNKTSAASKKESHETKTDVPEVSEEINPREIEIMEENDQMGYLNPDNENSRADQNLSLDSGQNLQEGATSSADIEKDNERTRDLEKLKGKAEKAERKVSKLKKKYKKAKKNEAKSSKMKALKEKLIKANAKLKRRLKKLKNAGE